MTILQYMLVFSLFFSGIATVHAAELLTDAAKIVSTRAGEIPQAPRVAPDGKRIVFEYYQKKETNLWSAASDGTMAQCLTCDFCRKYGLCLSLENGYWHPSGKYLLFNAVPEGNTKTKGIYAAALDGQKLGSPVQIASGARPQFSRPNGHVIFFETSDKVKDRTSNVLAYQILGYDPLKPAENMKLELRGPIQRMNESAEISHPSLAPDGTTIVFAARTVNLDSSGGFGGDLVLNDTDRQKIYKLWKALIPVDRKKINAALGKLRQSDVTPAIGNQQDLSLDDYRLILSSRLEYAERHTIVPGYSEWHLFLAWVMGLLDMLENRPHYDRAVQEMIFPRLWTTDVFGAPITPLVMDISTTPLPQKWPTVSHDGKFVVFEAGVYSNRHIYLIVKKNGQWMPRSIKITESGTYNSSPEIDPTGEWLYFESNRDGSKGIWRAKLNWQEIDKQLGL